MECTFDTCVDNGRQSKLSWERVVCDKCGKVKPLYNVSEQGTTKSSVSQIVQQVLTSYLKGGNSICRCKETFQEWFLSLLGLGYSEYYAECDKSVLQKDDPFQLEKSQDKDRKAGAVAFNNVRRTSKVNLQHSLSDFNQTGPPESKLEHELISSYDLQQTNKEYEFQETERNKRAVSEFRRKQSLALQKRRATIRRTSSASKSSKSTESKTSVEVKLQSEFYTFDKKLAEAASLLHTTVSSTTDLGESKSRVKKRQKPPSNFFNPFQNRIRNCRCRRLDILKSLYCPHLPCIRVPKPKPAILIDNLSKENNSDKPANITSLSICKDRNSQEGKKKRVGKKLDSLQKLESFFCKKAKKQENSPNRSLKQSEKPLDSPPNIEEASVKKKHCTEVTKSSSMPCTSCFPASKPQSSFCRCSPASNCGIPKLPCHSDSFHSTLLRSPSPRVSILPQISPCCRPCVVSTGRSRCRMYRCPASTHCPNKRSRSCFEPCKCGGKSPHCSSHPHCMRCISPNPCVPQKSACAVDACKLGSKPPICSCPPCCTKPCCLPVPRAFTVFPHCLRVDPTSKRYLSLSKCTLHTACTCPVGGPCSCTKSKKYPLPCCNLGTSRVCKNACSTPTAMSYIKAKQNNATCESLLNKYGFSKPPCVNFPSSCYGQTAEGLCPSSGCAQSHPQTPGRCGDRGSKTPERAK